MAYVNSDEKTLEKTFSVLVVTRDQAIVAGKLTWKWLPCGEGKLGPTDSEPFYRHLSGPTTASHGSATGSLDCILSCLCQVHTELHPTDQSLDFPI